jgi:alpha-beta hydrolase superfamily lysophospholipase
MHSLAVDHRMWNLAPDVGARGFAESFAALGYHVFALNCRGRPGSDGPHTGLLRWTADDYLDEDVPAALDHIERRTGARKVHWIGHSLGGLLGHAYQVRHGSARIQGLVTIGSALHYGAGPTDLNALARLLPIARALPYLPLGYAYRLALPLAKTRTRLTRYLYEPSNVNRDAARYFLSECMHHIASDEGSQLAGTLLPSGLRSADGQHAYTHAARKVTSPALLIAGDADRQCPVEAVEWTYGQLGSTRKQLRVFGRAFGHATRYGHQDLVWGRSAPREVWPAIASWLAATHDHTEFAA